VSSTLAHVSVSCSCWSTLRVNLLHYRIELGFEFSLLCLACGCLSVRVTFKELKSFLTDVINSLFVFVRELCTHLVVVECVFYLEAVVFQTVSSLHLLAHLFVLVFELLCILNHLLNFIFCKAVGVISDLDLLVVSICFVDSCDIQNAVSVDVESDFDLRGSTRRWSDTFEVERAKLVIILGHWSFTFIYLYIYSWLVIGKCSENLSLLCWNLSVPWDDCGHDLARSLNSL